MKALLIGLSLLLTSGSGWAQTVISEANLALTLPNAAWKLVKKDAAVNQTVYYFKREPIKNARGVSVIPNISVVVEPVGKYIPVTQFSTVLLGDNLFKVDSVYIWKDGLISYRNAIAYRGHYEDRHGPHTVYVVHALNQAQGLQIFFDVTSDLFAQLNPEFKATLKSLRLATR